MTKVKRTEHVDWLAVEFVCNGTAMPLSKDGATLRAAVLAIGYELTVDAIAYRLGTTKRQVGRILVASGAKHCPSCKRLLMLPPSGVLPAHVSSSGFRCRMSGYHVNDTTRLEEVRGDSRWIARAR